MTGCASCERAAQDLGHTAEECRGEETAAQRQGKELDVLESAPREVFVRDQERQGDDGAGAEGIEMVAAAADEGRPQRGAFGAAGRELGPEIGICRRERHRGREIGRYLGRERRPRDHRGAVYRRGRRPRS